MATENESLIVSKRNRNPEKKLVLLGDLTGTAKARRVYGYIKDIDYSDFSITINIGHMEPDELQALEDQRNTMEPVEVSIRPVRKSVKMKTMPQHRKFFAMLRDILMHKKKKHESMLINALAMRIIYREIREVYFPTEAFTLGGEEYFTVPSIRALTMEQLSEVIQRMYDDYSTVGVDFDEYKRFSPQKIS
jgi:hypothetical protein